MFISEKMVSLASDCDIKSEETLKSIVIGKGNGILGSHGGLLQKRIFSSNIYSQSGIRNSSNQFVDNMYEVLGISCENN